MMGGGGTDGSLNADPQGAAGVEARLRAGRWRPMTAATRTVATNVLGGYQDDDANAGGSAHFAIDAQARRDYGYNGIEKTATTAKQIISYFYGLETVYSYIMGCSNGGRDAMVASQTIALAVRRRDLAKSRLQPAAGGPCRSLERAGARHAFNQQGRQRPTLYSRHVSRSRTFRWHRPRS